MFSDTALTRLYAKRAYHLPDSPDEPELGEQPIDFTFGHPDPAFFPIEDLKAAISTAMTGSTDAALQYTQFRGNETLLELLASYLSKKLGRSLSTSNLIVTNGSMQVLGLMAHVFIDPGDIVITEAPTYFRAVTIFRSYEAKVVDIPIDEHGIRVDILEDFLRKQKPLKTIPKFLYTIPTHQNPSGTILSLERRRQLLDLSAHYGFLILEDTAYNDLWYDAPPPQSLFELDKEGRRVIQMGTFSKIIAPGLGVGWAVGDASVIRRFVEFKVNGGTTPLTSLIAAAFIKNEHFEQHLDSLRQIYKAKRDTMIVALKHHIPQLATWLCPNGGYFVWIRLADKINSERLYESAVKAGVIYLPGEYCFASPVDELPQIRLAFSQLGLDSIEEGVIRLSKAIKDGYRD